MKAILWLVPLCILVACGSDNRVKPSTRDTLTERQKDSIVAHSKIPTRVPSDRDERGRLHERAHPQQRHGGEDTTER